MVLSLQGKSPSLTQDNKSGENLVSCSTWFLLFSFVLYCLVVMMGNNRNSCCFWCWLIFVISSDPTT